MILCVLCVCLCIFNHEPQSLVIRPDQALSFVRDASSFPVLLQLGGDEKVLEF